MPINLVGHPMPINLVGHIVAVLDGDRQRTQAATTIHDRFGQPCRVTIEEVVPATGPEFDARKRLGDRVKVDLFLVAGGEGIPFLSLTGKVVEAVTHSGGQATGMCTSTFTIEHREQCPSFVMVGREESRCPLDAGHDGMHVCEAST